MATVLFWASVLGTRLRAEPRDAHLKGAHTEADSAGPVRAEALTLTVGVDLLAPCLLSLMKTPLSSTLLFLQRQHVLVLGIPRRPVQPGGSGLLLAFTSPSAPQLASLGSDLCPIAASGPDMHPASPPLWPFRPRPCFLTKPPAPARPLTQASPLLLSPSYHARVPGLHGFCFRRGLCGPAPPAPEIHVGLRAPQQGHWAAPHGQ